MELINIPTRIYDLPAEYQLSVAAQCVLWQLCADIYRRHHEDTGVAIGHTTLAAHSALRLRSGGGIPASLSRAERARPVDDEATRQEPSRPRPQFTAVNKAEGRGAAHRLPGTNASRRTVARALAELERHRIIIREPQTDQNGHHAASRVWITIPAQGPFREAPSSPSPDHP